MRRNLTYAERAAVLAMMRYAWAHGVPSSLDAKLVEGAFKKIQGERCEAICHTGPGHQSTFRCERVGPHPGESHESVEGGWLLEWDEDGEMV